MTIIAIEAADSMGKDTLVNLIKAAHHDFSFISFPDEISSSGQLTRKILSNSPNLPPIVLQHLFISNFFENYEWLSFFKRSDCTLIINRYFMSTLAYSVTQNININHFKHMVNILPQPDLWILLEGERRETTVGDRHDTDQKLQSSVMANYRALFKRYPQYPYVRIINDSTPEAMLQKFETHYETLIR